MLRLIYANSAWFFLSIFVLTTGACSTSAAIHVPSIDEIITIDGDNADWAGIHLHYIEESVRIFGLSHDKEHLYVMWRFSDERLAQTISRRGVVIWLDGKTKKRKTLGIRYAGSVELAESLPQRRERQGHEGSLMLMNAREPGMLEVISGDTVETFTEQNKSGPQASSKFSDGIYCYELSLPLAIIDERFLLMSENDARDLQVGVEIGGMSTSERKEMNDQMQSAHGNSGGQMGGRGSGGTGGRGGGRGGMGSGGGSRGGGRNVQRLMEGETIWINVEIERE